MAIFSIMRNKRGEMRRDGGGGGEWCGVLNGVSGELGISLP